jgi:transglutaminase-like putative cysteine protease
VIVRWVALLPILVVALSLGSAADAWPLAITVAVVATLLALVGPRWELDRGRQVVTSAMGAGAGYAAAAALHEWHVGLLNEGWTRLAASGLLAAAARFVIVQPRGGRIATMALVFASLVATGQTRGELYVGFVVLFLATSIAALGGSRTNVSPHRIAIGATILLLAAGLGLGATVGVRRAHAWISNRVHSTAFTWRPRVGFSDQVDLGALDGLLDSETVVLRVRGPSIDYLRGASLDLYEAGRWVRSDRMEIESNATYYGDAPSGDVSEVAAVSERTDRFFLPLEAQSIVTNPPDVVVNGLGSVKRAAKHGRPVARFVRGPRDRAALDPPLTTDLQLPRRMRPVLERLAAEWVGSATDPGEIIGAIERHLRTEYQYARAFKRGPRNDPALDFLFLNKSGHCEYFATALALVARAARVPARVVMGYRVAEHSPFGYYVVRDRNAHAWVEAWIPGQGWTTRDATPSEALPQNRGHEAGYAASAVDALRVGYDELTDWLGRLTIRQTAIAWVAGFLILVWIVRRGARGRARSRPVRDDEAALPFLELLIMRLAREGYARRDDEPIERLAARIPDAGAARLLDRYAALRYGSIGDEQALADEVAAYVDRPAVSGMS